jgi:hypothetical protein
LYLSEFRGMRRKSAPNKPSAEIPEREFLSVCC